MSSAGDGFDVEGVRSRFTVLREGDFAFLDAPGGSLVPDEVADAIAEATRIASANMGGFYPTSQRVTKIQSDARVAGAAFMGGEPENIVLGPNMTTINFALTRAAARDFAEGDEIIVTALDHDGNVAPWRELARDRGLVLKTAGLTDDLRLDLDSVRVPHLSAQRTPPRRGSSPDVPEQWRGPNGAGAAGLARLKAAGQVGHPLGKNPGDVWRLATSAYRGGHFATFPVPLAERAILAGCPEQRCTRCRAPYRRALIRQAGGTAIRGALAASCACSAEAEPGLVLDPFMGAGSTAVAAERHGRDWLGIELNPEFARLSGERLAAARRNPP